jgi:hypothetical protein
MKKMLLAGLIISFVSGFSALGGAEEGLMADLVLFNGKIFTVDVNQPWAQAVAIRDGKSTCRANWPCPASTTPTCISPTAASICWASTCARPATKKNS